MAQDMEVVIPENDAAWNHTYSAFGSTCLCRYLTAMFCPRHIVLTLVKNCAAT